jgi:hypothetical protein
MVVTSHALFDLVGARESWRDHAACHGVGSALFHSFTKADQEQALEFCARCTVVAECAAYARSFKAVTGSVWGGRVVGRRQAGEPATQVGDSDHPVPVWDNVHRIIRAGARR